MEKIQQKGQKWTKRTKVDKTDLIGQKKTKLDKND